MTNLLEKLSRDDLLTADDPVHKKLLETSQLFQETAVEITIAIGVSAGLVGASRGFVLLRKILSDAPIVANVSIVDNAVLKTVPPLLPVRNLSDLPGASFKSIRANGEVVQKAIFGPMVPDGRSFEPAFIRARFGMPVDKLDELTQSYSVFARMFRQSDMSAKAERGKLFRETNEYFNSELAPLMKSAGIEINRAEAGSRMFAAKTFDLPLNAKFNGHLDLNNSAGMSAYLETSRGRSFLSSSRQYGYLLDLPQNLSKGGQLSATLRQEILDAARIHPAWNDLAAPNFRRQLQPGKTLELEQPLKITMTVPKADSQKSPRLVALLHLEETTHVFQGLNGGPLSATGIRIQNELQRGNVSLIKQMSPPNGAGTELLLLENDFVGVLKAFGIKPPAIVMNAAGYQRRTLQGLGY